MKFHGRSLLVLSVTLAACVQPLPVEPGDAGSALDGGDAHTDILADAALPPGDATLVFEPRFGPDAALQIDPLWRPHVGWDGASPVVIMLCATDDATCEAPLLVREVSASETDGDPIQNSFGPTITVASLPAGTYRLMVFVDDARSRELGLAWDDGFETRERAWGGVVSEWDLMLSADGERPAAGRNPAPAPIEVTLTDGESTDLGPLVMGHFHERDQSPSLATESGRLVVAVDGGVRIVDLATGRPIEVVEGSGYYTFAMADASGDAVAGTVCGMIRGADDVVWVLYRHSGGGFAVPFDAAAAEQRSAGRRVSFPAGEYPCRGAYIEHAGSRYLYVANASASTADSPREGIWYADVGGLDAGDITATRMTRADDPLLQSGVAAFASDGASLFLAISARPGDAHVPAECRGHHCAFAASIGAGGRPSLAEPSYSFMRGQVLGGSYPSPAGPVTCSVEAGAAGLAVAPFHDGRTLLFLGGCNEISVFDLSDRSALDYDGSVPGRPGLDATLFGEGMTGMTRSPDGRTLWVMPQSKSAIHFSFEVGSRRTTFSRWMALPIDLSSGTLPVVDDAYSHSDVDGYEGDTDLGAYRTPAIDPGLDVHYAFYRRYQVGLAPDSAGSTFGPAALPIGPSLAVSSSTLFFRGSGVPGVSGLGKGGNLGAVDLVTGRNVLSAHEAEPNYEFWQGGPGGEPRFGLDLTPESSATLATYGITVVGD